TLAATAVGGNNFAYGGTRTNYNIVEDPPTPGGLPPGLYPWTLNLQRQAFAVQGVSDPHALYVVFSGSNDIADLIGRSLVFGFESTKPASDQVVQGVKQVIEAFVAAGARDIVVPNLPDLGLVPRVFTRDPLPGMPPGSTLVADTATALVVRYNAALEDMLKGFAGVNIIRFDTFSFFREVVKNPATYGLTNVTAPCYTGFVDPAGPHDTVCATPETYLFWDYEHPTTAMHGLLAKQLLATLTIGLLDDLIQELNGMGLQRGIATALHTMAIKAKSMVTDGNRFNDGAAAGLLHAFSALVGAQRGIMIPADDADALMERAKQITELLEAMKGA
ncbi:partial Esterase EstA, partial [Planctomycetaceae bacterium]